MQTQDVEDILRDGEAMHGEAFTNSLMDAVQRLEKERGELVVEVIRLKEKLQCEYDRPLTPEERSAWKQLREAAEDIDSLFRINVAPHYNALARLGDSLRAIKAAEKGAAS